MEGPGREGAEEPRAPLQVYDKLCAAFARDPYPQEAELARLAEELKAPGPTQAR